MLTAFNLRDASGEWAVALQLAHASSLAYDEAWRVEAVLKERGGFDVVEALEGEARGFVAATGEVAVVAFAGTASVADWLSNLDLERRDWPPFGVAHQGFLAAAEQALATVAETLKQARPQRLWLTGHSRGGAIAAIAAAALDSDWRPVGVHTFGQPKFAAGGAAAALDQRLGARFLRFVNGDDLVARVPPGFDHCGVLRRLGEGDALAVEEAVAPERFDGELDATEFADLQLEIKRLKLGIETAAPEALGDHSVEQTLNASVEGILPGLAAHRLDAYISAILRQNAGRISRRSLEKDVVFASRPDAVGGDSLEDFGLESVTRGVEAATAPKAIPVLLRLRDPNWTPPAGVSVQSQIGTVVAAMVEESGLDKLQVDDGVASIEASRDAGALELATALPFVKGDAVHRPPLDETGDKALIGLIDTGCDIFHEAFRDAAGSLRVLAVWDQRDGSTPSQTPKQRDPRFAQDEGRLYTRAELEQMIQGSASAPPRLRDPHGHGTHVAGIAAGRAVPNGPDTGLAPDAGIVVVIPNMRFAPNDPPSLGYSVSHASALSFLKTVAGGGTVVLGERLPMVINVSLGMNAGAHDGTSALEAAFDGITGGGRIPGLVVVKSAGNEVGHAGHTTAQVVKDGVDVIEWETNGVSRADDYLEFWFSPLDAAQFKLRDPHHNESDPVDQTRPSFKNTFAGVDWSLELIDNHPDNGDSLLKVTISRKPSDIPVGVWRLEVTGADSFSGKRIHGWVERDVARAVRFRSPDDDMTLSIPGTATSVVTVSACGSKLPIRATSSSSRGWTRDGRQKPDLCAPGDAIRSAKSKTSRDAVAMTGTSMAAPVVTGALALVLSAQQKLGGPQHNARQLRTALIKSTQNFSGVANTISGFGVLDVEALFRSLIASPSTPPSNPNGS